MNKKELKTIIVDLVNDLIDLYKDREPSETLHYGEYKDMIEGLRSFLDNKDYNNGDFNKFVKYMEIIKDENSGYIGELVDTLVDSVLGVKNSKEANNG